MNDNALSIAWLRAGEGFPAHEQALGEGTPYPGLLAAGDVLDADTLQRAYAAGIFPWYSRAEPVLWWSTNPRMVLRPEQFRLHPSLRKTLRQFSRQPQACIRVDTAFEAVMQQCAASRAGQSGTWITADMDSAYCELHQRGLAHSVETWVNGEMVGGLYCVALGRAVFGESMFSRQSNASKIALAALVSLCKAHGVEMIDCQQQTAHLASLGAAPVSRDVFLESIARTQHAPAMRWWFDDAMWGALLG